MQRIDLRTLWSKTREMMSAITKCNQKTQEKAKNKRPTLYDPIETISETVNFYLTVSGSITPIWKLVRVTAPLAPTLASGSRKDTNTLILTMGRPLIADGKAQASMAMNNQILASLIAQAVTTTRVAP